MAGEQDQGGTHAGNQRQPAWERGSITKRGDADAAQCQPDGTQQLSTELIEGVMAPPLCRQCAQGKLPDTEGQQVKSSGAVNGSHDNTGSKAGQRNQAQADHIQPLRQFVEQQQ